MAYVAVSNLKETKRLTDVSLGNWSPLPSIVYKSDDRTRELKLAGSFLGELIAQDALRTDRKVLDAALYLITDLTSRL